MKLISKGNEQKARTQQKMRLTEMGQYYIFQFISGVKDILMVRYWLMHGWATVNEWLISG